jgi:phospholipid/cholesterol/gamma-HCH transport system substrate-binding protein
MEFYFKRIEKIVGTFVLCIAVLLLAVVIFIGRGKDWFQSYINYYAMFDQNYNLEVNTPVKLFKADIGKVKSIHLSGDKVEVQIAILEEYASRIRSDSYIKVESPTFMIGSEYVSLHPGRPEMPQIPKEGMIPTRSKRTVSDVVAEFELEKTARMLIKAIQDLSDLVITLRDPNGPLFSTLGYVEQTTAHVENIARDIREGKGSIGSLLKSRELIEAINDKLASIDDILDSVGNVADNVDRATAKAPRTMDQVQDNLASVKKVVDGVDKSVDQLNKILADVDVAVDSVHRILKNVEKGSDHVPEIAQSTKGGIQEIRQAVDNIDKIVQSLHQNFLIRANLPPEPEGENVDAGLRR